MIRAPFQTKESLRARGYRWMPEMRNGIERAWWTNVEPDEEEVELAWLREAVYGGACGITCPRAGSRGGVWARSSAGARIRPTWRNRYLSIRVRRSRSRYRTGKPDHLAGPGCRPAQPGA